MDLAIPPIGSRANSGRITPQTARALAAKAQESRRRNAANLRDGRQEPPPHHTANQPAKPSDSYVCARLSRVRAQLDALDRLLAAESAADKPDAQRLDRLASASARLSEQERQLDNRPLPGSRRPAPEPPPRSPMSRLLDPFPDGL